MLSKSQPLFYTSCQRATHEYVCGGGRSHNLCKVASCIMQPIYASTGCESTQEYTHTRTHLRTQKHSPTHVFTNHTVLLWQGSKQTPEAQVQWMSHPEVLESEHKYLLHPCSSLSDLLPESYVFFHHTLSFLDLVLPAKGQRWDLTWMRRDVSRLCFWKRFVVNPTVNAVFSHCHTIHQTFSAPGSCDFGLGFDENTWSQDVEQQRRKCVW